MGDNEIVKALECCLETSGVNCGKCPYCDNCVTDENTSLMMTDALDLINRLKAEIERLQKAVEDKGGLILIETAKSEAYREFADKVKMEAENATCVYEPDRPQADNMVYHISNIRLNKILKELVGEDE